MNNYELEKNSQLVKTKEPILNKLTLDSNGDILANGKSIGDNSSSITNYNVAGVGGVLQYTFGYISSSNTIMTASSNNITHCNKVVGLIIETKAQGEQVKVQISGEVSNTSWNLVAGYSYYLGNGGTISNVAPTTGFIQKVGIAKNSTTLSINLGQPIKLI